jgi:GLPGLI family protein
MNAFSQLKSGRILFERKTNLHKRFKGDSRDWIKDEDKIKIDVFELYFNDSLSAFIPKESELKEKMSWATSKSSVFVNHNSGNVLSVKSMWGEQFFLQDTLKRVTWKVTDSFRKIGGFNCRKAVYQPDDSTRIYAWYCDHIIPSVGPEGMCGLPGAILGLATEDGGVIYFAKIVEAQSPTEEVLLAPKVKKSKIYTREEFVKKLKTEFGDKPWVKQEIKNILDPW